MSPNPISSKKTDASHGFPGRNAGPNLYERFQVKRLSGVFLALVALGSPSIQTATAASQELPAKAASSYLETWRQKPEASTLFCMADASQSTIPLYSLDSATGTASAQVAGVAQVLASSEMIGNRLLFGPSVYARVEMFAATISGPGAAGESHWVMGLVEITQASANGAASTPVCNLVFPISPATSANNAIKQFEERDTYIQQARAAAAAGQMGLACFNPYWIGVDGYQCCRCAHGYGMELAGCAIAFETAFWSCLTGCLVLISGVTVACLKLAWTLGPVSIGTCFVVAGVIGVPACLGACAYWGLLAEKACVINAQKNFLDCLSDHGCTEAPGG